MTQRNRKLAGTIILLCFLIVYALCVMVMSIGLDRWSPLGQAVFYACAGLLWVIPALFLVRWMQRPDR